MVAIPDDDERFARKHLFQIKWLAGAGLAKAAIRRELFWANRVVSKHNRELRLFFTSTTALRQNRPLLEITF
jgi:hypothetical protein